MYEPDVTNMTVIGYETRENMGNFIGPFEGGPSACIHLLRQAGRGQSFHSFHLFIHSGINHLISHHLIYHLISSPHLNSSHLIAASQHRSIAAPHHRQHAQHQASSMRASQHRSISTRPPLQPALTP
jgi:hypothetical protein